MDVDRQSEERFMADIVGGYDLVNATWPKPGVWVTMPVIVLIDIEAFAGERTMLYTAKFNKSGSAK